MKILRLILALALACTPISRGATINALNGVAINVESAINGVTPVGAVLGQTVASTPIAMDVLWRLTQGTSGNVLTLANINAGLLGATAFTASRTPFNHTEALDITPIVLPTAFSSSGTTVSSVSKALNFDLTEALSVGASPLYEGVTLAQAGNFSSSLDEYCFVYVVKAAPIYGTSDVGFDVVDALGTGFAFPQIRSLTSLVDIRIHAGTGDSPMAITLNTSKNYLVSVRCSQSEETIYMEVLDISAGQSIGAIVSDFSITALDQMDIQDYLLTTLSGGGSMQVALFGLREATDVFPFWPYVAPVPDDLARTQLAADQITLTCNILTPQFEVFRSVDGGGYSSIGTFDTADYADTSYVGAITFTDSDVEDEQVLLYRIYAKTLGYTSAVGQFSSITVDNGPFVMGSPIVTAYPSGFEMTILSGFKFTWNSSTASCTELGFMPSALTSGTIVVTVRADSGGAVLGSVNITGPYTPGTEIFASLMTPFNLTNGTVYRLTIDSTDGGGVGFRGTVGTGGFTFSPNITSTAPVAPDGSDPVVAACVNLKYIP